MKIKKNIYWKKTLRVGNECHALKESISCWKSLLLEVNDEQHQWSIF